MDGIPVLPFLREVTCLYRFPVRKAFLKQSSKQRSFVLLDQPVKVVPQLMRSLPIFHGLHGLTMQHSSATSTFLYDQALGTTQHPTQSVLQLSIIRQTVKGYPLGDAGVVTACGYSVSAA